jgi:hypothetical protein
MPISRASVSAAELIENSAAVPPAEESGVELGAPRARAKAIARPERQVAVRVFRAAVEASPLSQRQIAKRLDVDEKELRRYLDGERPIPYEKLFLLPPRCVEVASVHQAEDARARAIPTTGEPTR